MLFSHRKLYKRLELLLFALIALGTLLLFVQYVPLWTAGVAAFVVLAASAWADI